MKTVPTIHELRKKGWKVRVGHHRKYFRYNRFSGRKEEKILLRSEWQSLIDQNDVWYLSAMGGVTVITITVPDYDKDFAGVSECSDEEHYRRSTGVKKALARALSIFTVDQRNTGN